MVLSETGRLQLFGVIRGGLRVGRRLRPIRGSGLTVRRRLALEPSVNRTADYQPEGRIPLSGDSRSKLRQLALLHARR